MKIDFKMESSSQIANKYGNALYPIYRYLSMLQEDMNTLLQIALTEDNKKE